MRADLSCIDPSTLKAGCIIPEFLLESLIQIDRIHFFFHLSIFSFVIQRYSLQELYIVVHPILQSFFLFLFFLDVTNNWFLSRK